MPPAGDPIDCIVDPDVPQNVMDTYCWIHSTFSIPNRFAVEVTISSGIEGHFSPPGRERGQLEDREQDREGCAPP